MIRVLNWPLKLEEIAMCQSIARLIPELSQFVMIAIATHWVMSLAQILMHYKLSHHPMNRKFLRNYIRFHHTYYSRDHLVSRTYLGDEGNNTPFFVSPVFLVGARSYLVLLIDLFVVQVGGRVGGVVLRPCHSRQGIPCRGIAASAVCLVLA
jgi:hypothetical protein